MLFIFHFGNAYNYSNLYMWKLTTSCPPHRGKDFRSVQVLTHHLIEKSQLCKNKIKWNERSLQLGLSPSSIFKANKLKSWNSWCCFLHYPVYPFTANGLLRSQIWGLWGQLTLIHFFLLFYSYVLQRNQWWMYCLLRDTRKKTMHIKLICWTPRLLWKKEKRFCTSQGRHDGATHKDSDPEFTRSHGSEVREPVWNRPRPSTCVGQYSNLVSE